MYALVYVFFSVLETMESKQRVRWRYASRWKQVMGVSSPSGMIHATWGLEAPAPMLLPHVMANLCIPFLLGLLFGPFSLEHFHLAFQVLTICFTEWRNPVAFIKPKRVLGTSLFVLQWQNGWIASESKDTTDIASRCAVLLRNQCITSDVPCCCSVIYC